MDFLSRYLHLTFEPSSLGVLQGLTDLAHGQPLCDENGNNYFRQFEDLQIPLLVICADKDDLVNVQDSLKCFESSSSRDKIKLVYLSEDSPISSYGHCDIMIGKNAVVHVWEKIRIWLDQRRKLGIRMRPKGEGEEDESYYLLEVLSQELVTSSSEDLRLALNSQ